jgi:hypothetical protein
MHREGVLEIFMELQMAGGGGAYDGESEIVQMRIRRV